MNGLVSVEVLNRLYTSVKDCLYPSVSSTGILDFLILIPCKGRRSLLETTLKRFNEENKNVKTATFLIEHSESPEYKDLAKEHGIGWFYIPLFEDKKVPQGQFNRALCFDIGFLYGYHSKYILCHDNDLLVPVDFWKKLKENIERENSEVLQTYSDRFVWQTSPDISKKLIENPEWFKDGFSVEEHCTKNAAGAKGGSLVISHEAYLRVGGHDPHFFYGYGPEDTFLWKKLHLFYKIGHGENPRIPLTHLWHPNAEEVNPFLLNMRAAFNILLKFSDNHLSDYTLSKSQHFTDIYNTIDRG